MYLLPSRSLRTFVPAGVVVLIGSAACTLWAFWQPASEEMYRARRLEMVGTQIDGRCFDALRRAIERVDGAVAA